MNLQKTVETVLGSTAGFMAAISLRNLSRQRRNSILTLLVISVSMMTFVNSVSIVASASLAVTEYEVPDRTGEGLFMSDYERFFSTQEITELQNDHSGEINQIIPRIRTLGRLSYNQIVIANGSDAQRSILVPFATDYQLEEPLSQLSSVLTAGILPQSDTDLCLTQDIATELSINVGSTVHFPLLEGEYNVSGIIANDRLNAKTDFTGNWILPEEAGSPTHEHVSGANTAFLTFSTMWDLFEELELAYVETGRYNQLLVEPTTETNLEALAQDVLPIQANQGREVLVSLGSTRLKYLVDTSISIRGITFMIFVLFISGLITLNTLLGAITARMSDIEVWCSVGANPSHIKFNFIFESLYYGIIGGTIGYLAAIGISFVGSYFNVTSTITPDKLEFNWLLITNVVSCILCLIAAIYPSRKASTTVVPSLKRSWKPSLTKMITEQHSFDKKELPITLEPSDFDSYGNYIMTKMEVPTFFKIKRTWPIKKDILKDGTEKYSFKLDVAVFSAEGTYALIQIWSIKQPDIPTMRVYAQVNPYSSFGESSGWAQNNTNFNKACFDTLDMLRQLSLKWRVEGRKYTIQRD